ncbi:MAG: hypothetical protein JSS28_10975 [Proteobacteria bacterium]|nr:hypothetical protein [Pseudomonadota bacterium]
MRRGNYARVTAADRPGVAQPVPEREVPAQPWGRILLGTVIGFALLLGTWEWHWRAFGVRPAYRNDSGLWAIQRRRIDNGEGNATVLVGSSRMFMDLQLDVWQKLDGERPIQLSWEGTTSLPFLEDLAADPRFTGRVIVGVAPELFFSGYGFHKDSIKYYQKQSPSQRIGQWLSMHLIEPFWAFDDDDYALATVIERQPWWPDRPGKPNRLHVRRLNVSGPDRATQLWNKVGSDQDYRVLASRVWMQDFVPSDDDPKPEAAAKTRDEQIDRAAKAVAKLRARGVKVLFVRPPSAGPYLEYDLRLYPRASSWDTLLAKSGAPGIYFSDYPELSRDWYLPEWSHMQVGDARRFTANLHAIVVRNFWKPDSAK